MDANEELAEPQVKHSIHNSTAIPRCSCSLCAPILNEREVNFPASGARIPNVFSMHLKVSFIVPAAASVGSSEGAKKRTSALRSRFHLSNSEDISQWAWYATSFYVLSTSPFQTDTRANAFCPSKWTLAVNWDMIELSLSLLREKASTIIIQSRTMTMSVICIPYGKIFWMCSTEVQHRTSFWGTLASSHLCMPATFVG